MQTETINKHEWKGYHWTLPQTIFVESFPIENSLQLQPSEQDVPLEEFFWTGSGDGPAYIKPRDPTGHEGKYPNTIVRTATILATVYIDGNYVGLFDTPKLQP